MFFSNAFFIERWPFMTQDQKDYKCISMLCLSSSRLENSLGDARQETFTGGGRTGSYVATDVPTPGGCSELAVWYDPLTHSITVASVNPNGCYAKYKRTQQ